MEITDLVSARFANLAGSIEMLALVLFDLRIELVLMEITDLVSAKLANRAGSIEIKPLRSVHAKWE